MQEHVTVITRDHEMLQVLTLLSSTKISNVSSPKASHVEVEDNNAVQPKISIVENHHQEGHLRDTGSL